MEYSVHVIFNYVNLRTSLISICISMMLIWCLRPWPSGKHLPPGPFRWPIIGCLPGLVLAYYHDYGSRISPSELFAKQSGIHGKIFSLFLGSKLVVVLNDHEAIREAFLNPLLSDRPMFFEHMPKNSGVLFGNGNIWRIQRRFTLATFRNFGMGTSKFQDKITEETQHVIKEFKSYMYDKFDPCHILSNAIANVICSVIFGKRFQYSDDEFQKLLQLVNRLGNVSMVNILTFRGKHRMGQDRDELRAFVGKIVGRHKSNFDINDVNDYIYVYLKELQEGCSPNMTNAELNDESLLQTVVQLFIAGTETTVNTLRWALLYMMKFPEVQVKVQREIDSVVGANRLPVVSDNLPYTEATLMEVQRIATIIPLGVPHCAMKDTTLGGFHVPKGTIMLSNIWAVHHDPDLWLHPDQFYPERFLDGNGTVSQPGFYIPFSAGRRMCLGENLARMELFIIFTHLLQRFSFNKPVDSPELSLRGSMGATNSPQPYEIHVTER